MGRDFINKENKTEPIRQHLVPKLYLKRFAIDGKFVYVKQRKTGTIFKANIDKIAVEKNFYTVNSLKDKYEWEKRYATIIEPQFQKMLQKVVFNGTTPLLKDRVNIISVTEKKILSLLIVFQMMRSKKVREYEEKLYQKLGPEIITDTRRKLEIFNRHDMLERLDNYNFDYDLLKSILFELHFDIDNIEKYATILFEKKWLFYCIDLNSKMNFVSSDNPIIVVDIKNINHGLFNCGIATHNAVIGFPISPNVLLGMYSNELLTREYDLKKIIKSEKKDISFINHFNKQQLMQCDKFVISKTKEILGNL